MKINQKYVSFYYQGMAEVPDMQLERSKTALLIIDMQKEFVKRHGGYIRADCLPEGERKGQSQSTEHLWLE